MATLTHTLPLFLTILLGYCTTKLKFIGQKTTNDLIKLIFYIILPITLFTGISQLPLNKIIYWPFILAYTLSVLIMIIVSSLFSYFLFKRSGIELIPNTMGASITNSGLIGLPLFLVLFGTITPIAASMLPDTIWILCFVFCLEYLSSKSHTKIHWLLPFIILLRTPLLLGIFLGFIMSATHISLPPLIIASGNIVKESAPFTALFALGCTLGILPISDTPNNKYEVLTLALIKTLLHPTAAWLIGAYLFHLNKQWLLYLILLAALPTAKNVFIFANQYGAGKRRTSLIVFLTTAISIITIQVITSLFST